IVISKTIIISAYNIGINIIILNLAVIKYFYLFIYLLFTHIQKKQKSTKIHKIQNTKIYPNELVEQ
ncbi:hypothetical protein C0J52_06329, partial [Blattella germanica]